MIGRLLLIFTTIILISFSLNSEKWIAPASADALVNPYSSTEEKILKKGQKIFSKMCWSCHGLSGNGDGPAAGALINKPGDFTTTEFQQQSDGAIFWKLSTGRGQMVGFEDIMTDDDRWKLVTYLRTYAK
ncbi:MAG: cytochrome C [Gammaproteobacteria bacterium]|nr:cytochrome C [Gammaproteobacteria bacterium]